MRILYHLPTRERPAKAIKCLENITSLARHDDYIILLTLDLDDPSTANRQFHDKVKAFGHKVMPVYGFSDNKVHSVNRDIWMVQDWDIIVSTSDDVEFTKEGFDLDIISDMAKYFPNNDGFLHYPDNSPSRNVLATVSIMGRNYFDLFGYVYHENYITAYADNEATDIAKRLKKYIFVNKEILKHNHYRWTKEDMDELYIRNEAKELYAADNITFQKRKKANYYL